MTTRVFENAITFEQWDDDYYQPIARRYYDRAIGRVLRGLGASPAEPVLDAGCGPGIHSIRAAQAGYQVHAIDVSATVLEEARRRARAAGVEDRIQFQQDDLTALSLPSDTFRAVFSWGVLMHIPQLAKALSELIRILAPGGRLAIQTTNRQAWDYKCEAVVRTLLRKRRPLERHELGTGCWYEFNGERLWVWRTDFRKVSQFIEERRCRVIGRFAGEFTETHRRFPRSVRSPLLRLNDLWFKFRLPASPACTNILLIEKESNSQGHREDR